MRTAARHIILITLVATVLCADRAITALPAMNQAVAQVAGRVASRLAGNYRRNARNYRSVQWKTDNSPTIAMTWLRVGPPETDHWTFSPFQYRLPPPAV